MQTILSFCYSLTLFHMLRDLIIGVSATINNGLNAEDSSCTSSGNSILPRYHCSVDCHIAALAFQNYLGSLFAYNFPSRLTSINLKLASAIFYQNFIFHEMIALQKLWKIFFISSKKLFLFSRYSNFCIFIFPSFFSLSAIR